MYCLLAAPLAWPSWASYFQLLYGDNAFRPHCPNGKRDTTVPDLEAVYQQLPATSAKIAAPNRSVLCGKHSYHDVVTRVEAMVGKLAVVYYESYVDMRWANTLLPENASISNGSRVEVAHFLHRGRPRSPTSDNQTGARWLYHAPGSGVWFDVGRTLAVPTHTTAIRRVLGEEPIGVDKWHLGAVYRQYTRTFDAARRLGLDSIQFTSWEGDSDGQRKFELVDLRSMVPTQPGQLLPHYYSGLHADRPCVVAPHHILLRCQPDPRIPTAVSPPPAPAALTLPRSGAGGSASASASATRAMLAYTPSLLPPPPPPPPPSSAPPSYKLSRRQVDRLRGQARTFNESMAKAITQQPRNYSGSEYAKGVKKLEGLVRGLLSDYVREHSSVAAGAASCTPERHCVVATYSCPARFANIVHTLLSAFALAVVDNRPFVLRKSPGDGPTCAGVVKLASWVPDAPANLRPCRLVDSLSKNRSWGFVTKLMCRRSALPQCPPGSNGLEVAIAREAPLQFHEIAYIGIHPLQDRAATLFALGVHFALGAMFDALFSFEMGQGAGCTAKLALQSLPSSLRVAVHMRLGKAPGLSGDDTAALAPYVAAVRDLMHERGASACTALVASDSRLALAAIQPLLRDAGCTLQSVGRTSYQSDGPSDHGIDTGSTALCDIELLSSADAVVGTWTSTFSLLIAERIAHRRGTAIPTISMCWPGGACMQPLPLVSRRDVFWWHVETLHWPWVDVVYRDQREAPSCSSPNTNHSLQYQD